MPVRSHAATGAGAPTEKPSSSSQLPTHAQPADRPLLLQSHASFKFARASLCWLVIAAAASTPSAEASLCWLAAAAAFAMLGAVLPPKWLSAAAAAVLLSAFTAVAAATKPLVSGTVSPGPEKVMDVWQLYANSQGRMDAVLAQIMCAVALFSPVMVVWGGAYFYLLHKLAEFKAELMAELLKLGQKISKRRSRRGRN